MSNLKLSLPGVKTEKSCARVELGPSETEGHTMVTVLLFFPMHKICTKL